MNNQINTQQLISFLLNQQQEKSIEIATCYDFFINHLKIHNRTGTLSAYKATLKSILDYLKKRNIVTTAQITTQIINEYVLSRRPLVKPITINKEIKSLQIMIRLMIKNEYLDKMPFKFEPLKTVKDPVPQIEKDSIKKILKYFETSICEDKNKLVFLLILTTGIRTNELVNIKNKNIDLDNNLIRLEFTKNGETRNIFIVDKIKNLLIKVMNKSEYLFLDEHQNQMTPNAVRLFFKHLKHTLDIKVLSPHKLRHYYATSIYQKSLDIYLVKELLGHKSIEMTQIYLDINKEENQKKNSYYSPLNDF